MIDNITLPIYQTNIDGKLFLGFPVYFIRLVKQNQQQEIEEIKIEEIQKIDEEIAKEKVNQDSNYNFNVYMYPGQSKNYYKNIGNKLSEFISKNFNGTEIRKDPLIQKFLKIKKQKQNKIHLSKLVKSKIARQIIKLFFGNHMWCANILSQQKSEVEFYLTLNKQIFKRKQLHQKKQILIEQNQLV